MPRVRFLLPLPFPISERAAKSLLRGSFLYVFYIWLKSIIRVLAKPTECVVSLYRCCHSALSVRFRCIPRLCLPIHRHALDRSIPFLFLSEKSMGKRLIRINRTGCLGGACVCAGYVPIPTNRNSRITNNLFSFQAAGYIGVSRQTVSGISIVRK